MRSEYYDSSRIQWEKAQKTLDTLYMLLSTGLTSNGVCRTPLSWCVPLKTCIPYVNRESLSGRISRHEAPTTSLATASSNISLSYVCRIRRFEVSRMRRDPLVHVIHQECLISSASNIDLIRPRQALSRKGHGRGEERINYQDHTVLIGSSSTIVALRSRKKDIGHLKRYRTHRARQVDDASGMTLLMVIPSRGAKPFLPEERRCSWHRASPYLSSNLVLPASRSWSCSWSKIRYSNYINKIHFFFIRKR